MTRAARASLTDDVRALLSDGHGLLVEFLQLSDRVPPELGLQARSQPCPPFLFDFAYMEASEEFEQRLLADDALAAADRSFYAVHRDFLVRYAAVGASLEVWTRACAGALSSISSGGGSGSFDQLVWDGAEAKLCTELLALQSLLLYVVEQTVPGATRERLLIAHHRHARRSGNVRRALSVVAGSSDAPLHGVATLTPAVTVLLRASTQARGAASQHRPGRAWSELLSRLRVPEALLRRVLARLRAAAPQPHGRDAVQIALILPYLPAVMDADLPFMRDVGSRFFSGEWVVRTPAC
jgi:hypothetical protein